MPLVPLINFIFKGIKCKIAQTLCDPNATIRLLQAPKISISINPSHRPSLKPFFSPKLQTPTPPFSPFPPPSPPLPPSAPPPYSPEESSWRLVGCRVSSSSAGGRYRRAFPGKGGLGRGGWERLLFDRAFALVAKNAARTKARRQERLPLLRCRDGFRR